MNNMNNLAQHAKAELELAGMFDEDSDYDGMLGTAVMELVETFSKQEHSGFSAHQTMAIFKKVASYETLTPLTGNDDEWEEIRDGLFQNKRCTHVFKQNKKAYDINGKVFIEPNGASYISKESRVPVTFPCTPKTEYINVKESEN